MNTIRTLFKPYQPSIAYGNESTVDYEETAPSELLQEYIHCYWRLRSREELSASFLYRVVSDGCIDILFEQGAPEEVFITGFSTKYLEYDLGHAFDYVGVRFLPGGFPALFDIAADQLSNQFLPLSDISGALNRGFHEMITSVWTLDEAKWAFDGHFSNVVKTLPKGGMDPRCNAAMIQILESRGAINLGTLDVGVSERQLRRLFAFYFGESPKTFAKIVRFQNILGAKPSTKSLRYNKIFYDEGYYDQAHFIKEFKAFYGVTPNKAFGR